MSTKQVTDNRSIRVLQFLDAYEKQESLWNPSLESYKNKLSRDQSYMQIIKDLKIPELTIHDVKLKVKSIRTTYTKELRLLTKNKEDGKPYIPKLFWFHRADSFLKNVSLAREKRSGPVVRNYKEQPCENEPLTDCQDDGNTMSPTYEYKTLRHSDMIEPQQLEEMNVQNEEHMDEDESMNQKLEQTNVYQQSNTTNTTAINDAKYNNNNNNNNNNTSNNSGEPSSILVAQHNINCDDEYDIFCRSVASQLRNITDGYSRSVAKLKIQQILFEAETGHYRNSPCITIPVGPQISNNI